MAKEKFCGVYRKASEAFKKGMGTASSVVKSPEGWAQAEIEHLVNNPPAPDQRVSYSPKKEKKS